MKRIHLKRIHSILTLATASIMLTACCDKTTYEMGSYGYDAAFFKQHKISFLELSSSDGLSKIMIIPAYPRPCNDIYCRLVMLGIVSDGSITN